MARRCPFLVLALRTVLVLAVCGLLLLLYAAFIERTWIEETHHVVECPQWQGRPVRLAVLTDFHASPRDAAYLDSIVKRTLALQPDAVLMPGDFMNSHPGSPFNSSMEPTEIARHLAPLTRVPCFAVLGNHDHSHGAAAMSTALQEIGVHLVEGKRERLMVDGHPLDIAGIRCLYTFRTPGKVPRPEKGVPMLLLSHTPHGTLFAPRGTLLTVAGHTHGGQVCVPFVGAVYSVDKHVGCERASGYHVLKGNRAEYVSRGLGTSVLPLRFCCRPELLLLEIRSAAR